MGSHELVCQRAFSWSFSASPSPKEALSEIWPMDYVPVHDTEQCMAVQYEYRLYMY